MLADPGGSLWLRVSRIGGRHGQGRRMLAKSAQAALPWRRAGCKEVSSCRRGLVLMTQALLHSGCAGMSLQTLWNAHSRCRTVVATVGALLKTGCLPLPVAGCVAFIVTLQNRRIGPSADQRQHCSATLCTTPLQPDAGTTTRMQSNLALRKRLANNPPLDTAPSALTGYAQPSPRQRSLPQEP